MSTDVWGVIEVRHPLAGRDWYEGEPWSPCMQLYPLYDGSDYLAFGCLFGVRNWIGWEPVAADRGLPADVSTAVRVDCDDDGRADSAVHGSTWVSWAELRDLDMSVRPAARGLLQIHESPGPTWQYRVDDVWPDKVIKQYGLPPGGASPADLPPGHWTVGDVAFEYGPVTRLDVLGPGTGWEHVFAVMRALAGRFGEDGVRLIVWFY